jgi:biotin carboxyl carrier protein
MKLKITVHGVAYEVDVEVLDAGEGFPATPSPLPRVRPQTSTTPHTPPLPPKPAGGGKPASATISKGGAVTSPIAGTVIELKCNPGDSVSEGQVLLVIEAMKMNTSIAAPTAGKIKSIPVAVGDTVREGQALAEFE